MQHMTKVGSPKQCKQFIDRALHTLCTPHSVKDGDKLTVETLFVRNIQIYHSSELDPSLPNLHCASCTFHMHQQIRSIMYENVNTLPDKQFTNEDTDKFLEDLEAASLKNIPFGYYEILGGIPRTSKMSDIKHAYFRLAKRYHPDAYPDKDSDNPESRRKARIARFRFDEITEAYQTLMDLNQRSFYDQHGYAAEALRKQGLPSIFDYVPKYGIYEEQILSDNETTELEDWFASQGHSVRDQNITMRQRLKNCYIELRWGFIRHDFPWRLKEFFTTLLGLCIGSAVLGMAYGKYIRERTNNLPDNHPHKPILINNKWENDDIRDILKFYGVRKTKPSELRRAGRYDGPLTGKEEEKRKQNWLDGKLFSERQYESWREHSRFNKTRHRAWVKEEKDRKITLTNEKRTYWESRIALIVSEIEKFKLDEHIIQKAEASNSDNILSKAELGELKANHATTNMTQLNSKLNSAKKELDDVISSLEILNDPNIEKIQDKYILPPSPGAKDFKVTVGEANLSILDTGTSLK